MGEAGRAARRRALLVASRRGWQRQGLPLPARCCPRCARRYRRPGGLLRVGDWYAEICLRCVRQVRPS